MTPDEFRKHAHELVEWMAAYMENVERYPVKSSVKPGEIFNKIPDTPPSDPESFDTMMKDFDEIIMPGITHWQSPNFFAYFPANTSPPSNGGSVSPLRALPSSFPPLIRISRPRGCSLPRRILRGQRAAISRHRGFGRSSSQRAGTVGLFEISTGRSWGQGRTRRRSRVR